MDFCRAGAGVGGERGLRLRGGGGARGGRGEEEEEEEEKKERKKERKERVSVYHKLFSEMKNSSQSVLFFWIFLFDCVVGFA